MTDPAPHARSGRPDGAALLPQLHQLLWQFTSERLEALFAAAPSTLLDWMERAGRDDRRAMLDCRAALREAQDALLQRCRSELQTVLRPETRSAGGLSAELHNLSLQSDQQLEEMMLLSEIIARAEERNALLIADVEQRLQAAQGQGIALSPIGLRPFAVCQGLRRACEATEPLAPVRRVVYRLIDRFVVDDMPALYEQLSHWLESQGLEARQPRPAAARPRPQAAPAAADPGVSRALAQLRQLFGDGAAPRGVAPSPRGAAGGGAGMSDADLGQRIVELLQRSAQQVHGNVIGMVRGVSQRMELATRLVDGFDADPDVPGDIRRAMAQLRFPVIKAALADENFLRAPQHPLRRLLEELHAMAVMAPIVGEQTTSQVAQLIGALRAQVDLPPDRVAASLESGGEVEAAALAGFQQAQEQADVQRRESTAQRVRAIVDRELSLRLAELPLPEEVGAAVQHAFGPMLCIQLARHGRDSARWQTAVGLLEQFFDAVRPALADPAQRCAPVDLLQGRQEPLLESGMGAAQLQALVQALQAPGFAATPATAAAAPSADAYDATIPEPGRERRRRKPARDYEATLPLEGARPRRKFSATRTRSKRTAAAPEPLDHVARLKSLLVTGTWFRVYVAADGSTQWLKLSSYYVPRDVAAFATFDGTVALSVPGARLVEDLVARRTEPVTPDVGAQAALDDLVYQVRLRGGAG